MRAAVRARQFGETEAREDSFEAYNVGSGMRFSTSKGTSYDQTGSQLTEATRALVAAENAGMPISRSTLKSNMCGSYILPIYRAARAAMQA